MEGWVRGVEVASHSSPLSRRLPLFPPPPPLSGSFPVTFLRKGRKRKPTEA